MGTRASPVHRTGVGHMKPVTPLQAAIIRNLNPPTPLLTEEAVKTAIVRWRRCHRFQSRQQTGVQRNHPFHSTSIGLVMPSQVGTSCPLSGRARQNSPSTTPPVTVPRKTRPARPLQRHFREKTRPASAKTLNLGQFERTGRTFSRFHDLTATQGELFRVKSCGVV